MNTSIDMEKLREDAVHIFNSGFTCSESVIYAIKKNFELEMSDDAIAMSSGFPWGLGGAGRRKKRHLRLCPAPGKPPEKGGAGPGAECEAAHGGKRPVLPHQNAGRNGEGPRGLP